MVPFSSLATVLSQVLVSWDLCSPLASEAVEAGAQVPYAANASILRVQGTYNCQLSFKQEETIKVYCLCISPFGFVFLFRVCVILFSRHELGFPEGVIFFIARSLDGGISGLLRFGGPFYPSWYASFVSGEF